jgi:hypothetical protein
MVEDYWRAHIAYLEDEVKKIDERAEKIEAMLLSLQSEQKKHALRELINRIRDEAREYRKYLALVKQK